MKIILSFLLRWLFGGVGMWVCISWFGEVRGGGGWVEYAVAGLIFALVNMTVRPLATILSLPLIFLTMGVFTVVLNSLMIGMTVAILPDVKMSVLGAIGSAVVMSVLNFIITIIIPEKWLTKKGGVV
jgi:putative membrane protein